MSRQPDTASGGLWPLVIIPVLICFLGLAVVHFDLFPRYRQYAGRDSIPQILIRSGRTGKELRLLDYQPLRGVRLEGFDGTIPPQKMPSSKLLAAEAQRSALPTLSVVIDSQDLLNPESGLLTNYTKRGRGWERPVYVSYFRGGELVWAGGAGLRVHGGKSRAMTRKSFRLHFRELYGMPELPRDRVFDGASAPIHSLVVHNDLRVRKSPGVETNWHYMNPLAYAIANRIGCITPATQPVAFYINGVYQGPYVLTEHISPDFLISRFGHDDFFLADTKSDDPSSLLKIGSQKELRRLIDWPRSAPAPIAMAEVERHVDLANLTNWFISVLYTGTTDPFQGMVARDRTKSDGRWFWINWDMDHAFMDLYAQVPNPWEIDNFTGVSALVSDSDARAVLLNRLRTESPEYRRYFLTRITEVLNHELTDEFTSRLIERYQDVSTSFGIEDQLFLQILRDYVRHRPEVLRRQMAEYFAAGPSFRILVEADPSLTLRIDGRLVGSKYTGWYFEDTPVRVELTEVTKDTTVRWEANGRELASGGPVLELVLSETTHLRVRTN